jgi:hypothetical protein
MRNLPFCSQKQDNHHPGTRQDNNHQPESENRFAARYRAASSARQMNRVINAHSQVLEDRFFDSELIAISFGQKNCEIS